MRRILYKGSQKFEITDRCESAGDGYVPKTFFDQFYAQGFLSQFTDEHNMAVFRDIISREMRMCLDTSSWRNHEIIGKIVHLLVTGSIRIATQETREDVRKSIIKAHGIVPRNQWGNRKPKYSEMESDWNYTTIAIHHSGNWGYKNPVDIESKHMKERQWDDVGYHYLIRPNGKIYEGRKIYYKGAHVGGANTGKIGILVMGDFQHQWWDLDDDPTKTQLRGLKQLVLTLKKEFPLKTLGGHRDWGQTDCPGDVLYKRLPNIRKEVSLNAP